MTANAKPAPTHGVFVGCAGWSIRKEHADRFPADGSHLERYARRFPAVEINSSFYRPHRPSTYARWAEETPAHFAFAVKVPKEVTHVLRLAGADEPLARFLGETEALGAKRGPLLVQLPPSLAFDAAVAGAFFDGLRGRFAGLLACEPRHRTWFAPAADALLVRHRVARVAADPAVPPAAATPGGWDGLIYYRLHGSPRMYYSQYPGHALDDLARTLRAAPPAAARWCVFDNTALGAATEDALGLLRRLEAENSRVTEQM
jgi:uncharacterized protein YecE (DUF72 family)